MLLRLSVFQATQKGIYKWLMYKDRVSANSAYQNRRSSAVFRRVVRRIVTTMHPPMNHSCCFDERDVTGLIVTRPFTVRISTLRTAGHHMEPEVVAPESNEGSRQESFAGALPVS